MFKIKISLFSKTKALEEKIDSFHDKLIDSANLFDKAIKTFLFSSDREEHAAVTKQSKKIEHNADELRRDIENQLYAQNLLPNLQADILQLVESLDKINNHIDEVIYKFYVEQPEISENFKPKLKELGKQVAACCENMAIASRAFFKDISIVRDYTHKVYLMEQESDRTYNDLKKAIFAAKMPLANKLQLDILITEIAEIADIAEDCADELLIFTLKRDI
ncbi:MAG: DUF47 family protein [Alphaproteobacteria bacterium]|nr:DUF47 family protein [Alphaproteobacteria bacterium]